MRKSRSISRWLLFLLPLSFLAVFYFYPLFRIVLLSLLPDGNWDPAKLNKLLSTPVYLKVLWFTTWQAALSTILTLLLALPGAYIFARYHFPAKNFIKALLTIPFVLPTVVVAAAFRALLGNTGLVNTWLMSGFNLTHPPVKIDQSISFFILAHIFYNYSLILRIVGGFWSSLDNNVTEAARMLGASPWQTFRTITLPLLLPAIGSASLLVFIFCFTSFGVVLLLGGPGYATLEVEIYRQAIQLFNLPMAAALSLIQILTNLLLMWLHARISKRSRVTFFSDSGIDTAQPSRRASQKILVGVNVLFMLVLLVTPLLALVLRSFMGDDGFTTAYYSALFAREADSVFFVEPISAVYNSIAFGVSAMVIAVVLGLLAATFLSSHKARITSFWDALIMLPLATSAVTLGFGYIISLNTPPLNLRDSIILVPIAHALVALPFVVRCILPTLRQIPDSLREAAALLGASPLKVWRYIDFPIITPAILVGAVFAFSISMGEFGASAFVTRPHTPTIPVAIFRFLGQPGEINYGQAMAMSTLLMTVTCTAFWVIGKFDSSRKMLGPNN